MDNVLPRWTFPRLFAIYAGAGLTIYYLLPSERLFDWLLAAIAWAVGALASVAGVDVLVSGPQVVLPGQFGVEVAIECSGVPELILFLSAVFAFNAPVWSKTMGVAVAVAGVTLGNILRITALLLVGIYAPQYFTWVHDYVQGPISYVLMTILWIGWMKLSRGRAEEKSTQDSRQAVSTAPKASTE